MAKAAQDLQKGETVSWNWQGSHPKGKVEEVVEGKATAATKSGNEISINGDQTNPAVKIKTSGGNSAVKPASNIDGVSKGKPSKKGDESKEKKKDDKSTEQKKQSSNKKSQKEESKDGGEKEEEEEEDEEEDEGEEGEGEGEGDSNPKASGKKRSASQVKDGEQEEGEGEAEDEDDYVPSKEEAKAADEIEKEAVQSEEEVDEDDGEGENGADQDGEGVGEADGEIVDQEPAQKKAKTENGGGSKPKKNSKKDPKATRSLPARGAKEETETLNEDEMLKDEELEEDD